VVEAHQEPSMVITSLGIIKNERCFFTLFIIENKLKNKVKTHLYLVLQTYAQNIYTMEGFCYGPTTNKWRITRQDKLY
jgi:hypothetical protein